nr:thioesterase family protein [uncultured Noviherbaspirillum sp.]
MADQPTLPDIHAGENRVFATKVTVRFGDCDPAGIVFYPRYFEMVNNLVEDWCAQGLDMSFREMHLERGLGLPTVQIDTSFVAPSELGEVLQAELRVQKLGGASLTLAVRLAGPDGKDRVRASLVLVMMHLKERRAVRIPDALRERMAVFAGAE